jgi:uncharacterized RDD family membrane protein YckC
MMDETTERQPDAEPQWYYLKSGQPLGPVPETSIRAWLDSGFLKSGDFLWRKGLADWLTAEQLPEFAGAAGVPPPPPITVQSPAPGGGGRRVTLILPREPGASARAVLMAGFWLRVGAALIDWMLLSLTLFVAFRPVVPEATSFEEFRGAIEAMQQNRWLMIFSIVLPWLYFSALESSPWQATLGKKAFRLRVISVAGDRLGPLRASFRHLAKVVLMDLTFLLSFLPAGFTARKQALHDFAAGTFVIRE